MYSNLGLLAQTQPWYHCIQWQGRLAQDLHALVTGGSLTCLGTAAGP